jgi:hypothetical protein
MDGLTSEQKDNAMSDDFSSYPHYSLFWHTRIADMATLLVAPLGQDAALDVVHDAIEICGRTDELSFLVLRILKPDAPFGEERSA